jgi:hypothetical protein
MLSIKRFSVLAVLFTLLFTVALTFRQPTKSQE